jgi:hypothetical protein
MNTQEKVKEILDKNNVLLSNLAHRWDDESEYEDINEYKKIIEAVLGIQVLKMIDCPFGFVTPINGNLIRFTIKFRLGSAEITAENHLKERH